MAITLFGTASNPSDNGSYGGTGVTTITITPPSSMQSGDLVFVTACYGGSSGTIAAPTNDGQSWTSLTSRNATRCRTRSFWCVFNGTWDANPTFTGFTDGSSISARMLVFRSGSGTITDWSVDVAESSEIYTAPSTPFTVTVTGVTVVTEGAIVIVGWTSRDDNTWDSLTLGWTAISPAQVRNTYGTYDLSISHAWLEDAGVGATGDVSQNQATNGGDAGARIIMAFRAIERRSGASAVSKGGTVAALGAMAIGALSAVSAGPGHVAATGTAAWSANPIVKVINETLQRPTYDYSGSAAVSGMGHIVAAGIKKVDAASSVSMSGSVVATGQRGGQSATSETASGSAVSTGQKGGQGSAASSGNGSISASYAMAGQGSSSISSGGSLSSTASKGGGLSASISSGGSVSATGEKSEANPIVKVINETLQRNVSYSYASSVTGRGAVSTSGSKSVSGPAAVHGPGSVSATGVGVPANPIVKVINERLQRIGQDASVQSAISGGGSVIVSGSAPNLIVKVINESTSQTEGSFEMAQGIVQVVDESSSLVEVILRNPPTARSSVSGGGACATQGRKGASSETQVTGSGSVDATATIHNLPSSISGGGSVSVSATGSHAVASVVSGGGSIQVTAGFAPRSVYQRSFRRHRTGDPQMDRALQLIEEEFSRMLDYINRRTA